MMAYRGIGESGLPLVTPLKKVFLHQQPLTALAPGGGVEPYAKRQEADETDILLGLSFTFFFFF